MIEPTPQLPERPKFSGKFLLRLPKSIHEKAAHKEK